MNYSYASLISGLSRCAGSAFIALMVCAPVHAAAGDGPPNVVFILSDDVGYGDVGPNKAASSPVPTPNIDLLAQQGITFMDAHTPSSVCAPSRYSLLTGNYPYRGRERWGVWNYNFESNILANQKTVAEVMSDAGYATAFFGKMHLGGDFYRLNSESFYRGSDGLQIDYSRQFRNGPIDQGFDYSWVTTNGIQAGLYAYFENDLFVPINPAQPNIIPINSGPFNGGVIIKNGFGDANWDSRQVGPVLTQKALAFIDAHHTQHGTTKPFFMYFSSQAIHEPNTPPASLNGVPVQGNGGIDAKSDMIYELDVQVGQIVAALESRGIADNTLIIFTSDNGGTSSWTHRQAGHFSVGDFRGRKTTIYQGGHAVPFIARWGDGTSAGSLIEPGAVSNQLIMVQDWVRAMYALTGETVQDEDALDAANILPIMLGQQPENVPVRNEMVFDAAQWGGDGRYRGIRVGDYELVMNPLDMAEELYNIATDAEQQTNLIGNPQQATRISDMLASYDFAVNQSARTVPTGTTGQSSLYIADVTANEDAGTLDFTVNLAPGSSDQVTVNYATADISATAGADYLAAADLLIFEAGEISKQIAITLLDDNDEEGNESFSLTLSGPVNAALADGDALGTIQDDEAPACGAPAYSTTNDKAFFIWQDCQTGEWVTRQTSAGGYSSFQGTVSSSQAFISTSAYSHEGSDVFDTSNQNEISFQLGVKEPFEDGFSFSAPAEASICVNVSAPSGVNIFAGPERTPVATPFDPQTLGACGLTEPTPMLSVDNVSVSEGAGVAAFTVSLNPGSTAPVTVDYATSSGSAIAGEDFTATGSTLLFNPGETSQPVAVTLIDDGEQELPESFDVVLSNATGAGLADSTGRATINDNDGVACGAPAYNVQSDRAIFVWQSCSTGAWSLRATAGSGYIEYAGAVDASQNFNTVTPFSLESGDYFDISNPQSIDFVLRMIAPYVDGFDFVVPAGADICVQIAAPANADIMVGPARIPATTTPFNPATLEPC